MGDNASMYPKRAVEIDSSMPSGASYWVPIPSEANDEGYGLNFRDVHVLDGVSVGDAREVLQWERVAATWVVDGASDEEEFESRARTVESFDPLDPDCENTVDIPIELQRANSSLWGLELGVSGLSHVLAVTGFYPVASCRSHRRHSWSPAPVVHMATNEERLQHLQPLIADSGCGLDADESRGRPLFVIYAPSIVEIMTLAQELFEKRGEFRRLSKTSRRRSSPLGHKGSGSIGQETLF